MQIFQKTVLKEFVALQNQDEIKNAFDKFQAHFANKNIQENIKNAKEEQYQEGFLQDLFVNILGYTLNPQKDFNLISEQKTQNSAKKSDGAILKNGKVIGVIELKSMKTILLEDIQKQAFEYKNSHIDCKYIITSNFKKIRFYLENNVEYEDFDLFDLSFERFSVLYSVLHFKSISQDKPIKLKKESTEREEKLTLEFYNDYQGFKEALFLNIKENNKNIDELLIFQKTQKLLDRIIFMSFAKDKGLLPANYIKIIIQEWELYKQIGEKKNLYEVFKKHFDFINNGFSSEKYDIYAFNGGLFEFDEILDNFKIGDNILKNQSEYISRYDFESDIDVNVLGHIFEFSLAELDKKKAELSQKAKDLAAGKKPKEQPKRKEDGIFYTPIYITDYMIEETLGKMCEDKKTELSFENITIDKINRYRNWLLSVTVLDPACGSGAFLNQVLTFFMKEHQKLDELLSNLSNEKIVSNIYHQILENNIFGVDINLESISITKLSLWLRIAQGKRKLNDLSQNIKIGNSLIADKNVDGKAFDWTKEFSKMGDGFSLIVGNPPYVSTKIIKEKHKKYYIENYQTAKGQFDLYGLFIEKCQKMLKNGGELAFITSSSFLSNKDFSTLRKFLFEKNQIIQIAYLGETVFEQAAVDVSILIFKNEKTNLEHQIKVIKNRTDFDEKKFHLIRQMRFDTEKNNYEIKLNSEETDFDLIDKIYENKEILANILDLPRGIEIGGNSEKIINQPKKDYEKILVGKNIARYQINFDMMYIPFEKDKSVFKEHSIYQQPKILIQRIRNLTLKRRIVATLDVDNYLCTNTLRIGILKNVNYNIAYVLGVMNSKLVNFIFSKYFLNKDIYAYQLERIPIPAINLREQNEIAILVNEIINLKKNVNKSQKDVLNVLQDEFKNIHLTKKLENWSELSWSEFSTQLTKTKIDMSIKQKIKWRDFFDEEQPKIKSITEKIQNLEKEIDNLVYELYNLNEEEIQLIENQ